MNKIKRKVRQLNRSNTKTGVNGQNLYIQARKEGSRVPLVIATVDL